jgi:hypothetical protein
VPCSKSGHLSAAGDMPKRPVNHAWLAISPMSLVGESRRVRRAVCPAKGRSIGGCESRPGKPPEEPGSQPPASGEILAPKRGEAKLQAVTNVNSAASKEHPVRDRAGRARHFWAKTAVRAMESGAARNRSGVKETACSEGRSVNRGGPTVPDRDVDSGGSNARYKPHAKAGTVRRESERGIVPMIAATTQLGVGKAAHFGDARVARDG